MIVLDTSVIYALLDRRDRRHRQAAGWYDRTATPELATTPLIVAETDHLAATRAGPQALEAFRLDVASGAYLIEWWADAASESVTIAQRYEDLGVSLADASLVALAGRLGTTLVATFDERHFRAIRPIMGPEAFTLFPVDAA